MINYFVMLGLLLDLILTYNFLKIYKEKFPKKDYTAVETNPLIRTAIRSMGLTEGIIFSGFIILMILMVVLKMIPYQWRYFLAGVYYMMICFHLLNLLSLKRMEVKNGKRRNVRRSTNRRKSSPRTTAKSN